MERQVLDGWMLVVTGVLEAGLAAFIAYRGFRLYPGKDADFWGRCHGVAIDDTNRSVVHRYLTRGRRIRTLGFLVPLTAEAIVRCVAGLVLLRGGDWDPGGPVAVLAALSLVGYFGAAVVAELTYRPEPEETGEPGAAMAVARDVSAYLPRWVTPVLRGMAAAAVALAPVGLLVGGHAGTRALELVSGAAVALGAAVTAELVARHIVGRRQPVMAPHWLVLDDAVRSNAAHVVSGAGALLVAINLAGQLGNIVADESGPLSNVTAALGVAGGAAGLIVAITGLGLWLHLMQPSWWPVRRLPLPA
jgi:hypothetical protein